MEGMSEGAGESKKIERQMDDVVQELYWLDFAMNAPGSKNERIKSKIPSIK